MAFYGREKELQQLKNFFHSDRENLAVVYGRRRVGKSELLRASLCSDDIPFVFLQCRTTSLKSNVDDLMLLARSEFGLPDLKFDDIESAFKYIYAAMKDRRGILVLDEYPYLRELLPGCDSFIQYLVDENRGAGLKLVLCGSYLDVMKGMLEYKSPLYGRAGLNLHVEPMDYFDSALFYPTFSDEDKVRLYSVFGGVPFYNAKIDGNLSVRENIIRLLTSKDAVLANEVSYLLMLEISKISNAERVFETIANGITKFTDILAKSGFSSSPALVDILKKLVEMGLLKKVTPINDENNRKKTSYKINDNLINFYYRYVFKYQSRLSVFPAEKVFDAYIADDFETKYVPKAFEEIVKQFLIRENLAGRIEPPFFKIGSFWYDLPKLRKNGEFDVVTQDDDGYAAYECKFKGHPMTEAQVEQEIEQVKASPLPATRFGFVARSGFENVSAAPDRRFYSLADLYRKEQDCSVSPDSDESE